MKDMIQKPLTEIEADIAGRHYPLLLEFMEKFKLSDKYYDAVVTGYLEGVQKYLEERPECSFELHIKTCMRRAMRRQKRDERKANQLLGFELCSLEELAGADNYGSDLVEMMEDLTIRPNSPKINTVPCSVLSIVFHEDTVRTADINTSTMEWECSMLRSTACL